MHACALLATALLCVWRVGGESCERAQNRCVSRMGCSMALNMYFISCGALLHGETTVCSTKCMQSLISLISAGDQGGQDLMRCDCNGNDFCDTHRRRLAVCNSVVTDVMEKLYDDHSRITCSLAEMVCRADSPCLTALEYYQRHCDRLWRGEKCTSRCNNSLSILHRQEKARKLRSCICDGTEEYPYPCQVIKDNTEWMCFHNDPYATTTPPRIRHPTHHNTSRTPKVTDPTTSSSGAISRHLLMVHLILLPLLLLLRTYCW